MHGIRTWGRRMVGADETTELWRPPTLLLILNRRKETYLQWPFKNILLLYKPIPGDVSANSEQRKRTNGRARGTSRSRRRFPEMVEGEKLERTNRSRAAYHRRAL